MASLVRWSSRRNPVRRGDLATRGYVGPWLGADWLDMGPAVDMYETDEDVIVAMSLPGVNLDDISVKVTGDTLSVEGEMKEERESKERQYMHRERRYGRFFRSITLPATAEGSKAEATFDRGVLTVTVPKSAEAKPSRIQVKTK